MMFHNTKQGDTRRQPHLVQTIERVDAILNLLGQRPRGISISDLSKEIGLPKGTVHRLLSSLAYYGYIRQDQVIKSYSLGLKLLDLGSLVASQMDLRKNAEEPLRSLAEKCKETVHLVIMDRDEVVYIDKVETTKDMGGLRMASRVGSRNLAHCCAVGKVLLAYWPKEELDQFISRKGLFQRTANTITDPKTFREHLRMVKEQGYAIDDEENEKGIRCVAGPVFGVSGKPAGAISISGPAFRVTKKMIQEVLKKEIQETAMKISQQLGYRGM
jgi:DNA-binding IclR family transcriptional regulator